MGLGDLKQRPVAKRLMGIDASSQSIAFTVWADNKPVKWGKIYLDGKNIYEKCGDANRKMYALMDELDVDGVAIEAAIYVNNRQVVIALAQVFGSIIGVAEALGKTVQEVAPATWMSYIDNPMRPSAEEKDEVNKKYSDKSKNWRKNKHREIRKQRTINYFNENFNVEIDDDDVADSMAVGYYAYMELTGRD